jgi:hypothetical protein
MDTVRVATVRATGKQYIVSRIAFSKNEAKDPSKVFCFGEVVSYRGVNARHEKDQSFLLADVDLKNNVARTPALIEALFKQAIEGRRAAGHVLTTTRKGNVVDHGPPEQIQAAQAARAELNAAFRAAMDPQTVATLRRVLNG